MKTTPNLDKNGLKVLRRASLDRSCSMSSLVESALRRYLAESDASEGEDAPELPTFEGRARVDLAGRAGLDRQVGARGGVSLLDTRDTDFHRFPWLEPLDPMQAP
jgi:hypothetical protein